MAIQIKVRDQIIRIGDKVRVFHKILEEGKYRIQAFDGILIAIKGSENCRSITVRKIASGNMDKRSDKSRTIVGICNRSFD